MANGNSKVVAFTAQLIFNETEYRLKSIPHGLSETCDLPNVTTTEDGVQKFEEAALVEDGDFTFVCLGDSHPAMDEIGVFGVSLVERIANGEMESRTIELGTGFVTNLEANTIEAGGDRVKTWTVTIKPDGNRA